MAAPGDFVLARDRVPIGRVESVLTSASGERLLVARAFSRGGYSVVDAGAVTGTEIDADGLSWVVLSLEAEAVRQRGVFRRELSRLVPDPFPTPYGAPRPDDEAEGELRAVLRDDPMTRDGEIDARVRHGVAVLNGLIGTVGGKVAAERLARTVPGVWEAVNGLHSDEELLVLVRTAVRRAGTVADAIEDVRVTEGAVRVTLLPTEGASLHSSEIEQACRAVEGVRSVEVVAAGYRRRVRG